MGAPKLHQPEDYTAEILRSVEDSHKITKLEDEILKLRRHIMQNLGYIAYLEPRALAFDKLDTDQFKNLDFAFARSILSLAEGIDDAVSKIFEYPENQLPFGKELDQIITFAECIKSKVNDEQFMALDGFLFQIDDKKINKPVKK